MTYYYHQIHQRIWGLWHHYNHEENLFYKCTFEASDVSGSIRKLNEDIKGIIK